MSKSLAGGPRPGGAGPTRQQLDELDALLQRMLDLPVSHADEPEAEATIPIPAAPRPARVAPPPAPEPDVPPVRYYEPDYLEDEEDASPARPIGPRLVGLEAPVPGGRHDLEEDVPTDPAEELARIRAAMQQAADRQAVGAAMPESLPPTANIPTPPSIAQGEWVPLRSSTFQPSAQTWKPLAEHWEPRSEPTPPAPVFPPRRGSSGPLVMTQTSDDPEPPVISSPPVRPAAEPAATPSQSANVEETTLPWAAMPLVWFNGAFDVLLLPWCPKGKFLRGPGGRTFLGTAGVLCLMAAGGMVLAEWMGWAF